MQRIEIIQWYSMMNLAVPIFTHRIESMGVAPVWKKRMYCCLMFPKLGPFHTIYIATTEPGINLPNLLTSLKPTQYISSN